jgi:hypothetical protein
MPSKPYAATDSVMLRRKIMAHIARKHAESASCGSAPVCNSGGTLVFHALCQGFGGSACAVSPIRACLLEDQGPRLAFRSGRTIDAGLDRVSRGDRVDRQFWRRQFYDLGDATDVIREWLPSDYSFSAALAHRGGATR